MISVMKSFEIERKSTHSVTATADLSFLVMDSLQEGSRVSDGGYGGVFFEPRVLSRVGQVERIPDLEARVSGKVDQRVSGSLVQQAKMGTDGGDEDETLQDEGSRFSSLHSSDWMHGFKVGDMVWGKVKSHPWWPGHIFNEAFASPAVRKMKREAHVLVAFFGDSSYGWFDPAELIPFELNFPEKSRQTTSRNFVRAVEEAVDEASRRSALAIACRCRNLHNFRSTAVAGYFAVDVTGYEPGGIYSSRQIKKSRDSLVSAELLSFLKQLAVVPRRNDNNSIEWIQRMARLLAYRKAVFEEFDETYAQAFGVEPLHPSPNSMGAFDQTDRFAPRVVPLTGPLVVAENLGERRSSARQSSAKKNKYVLKRREDLPTAAANSLPDLPPASKPLPSHAFSSSPPESVDPPAFSVPDSNFVLRKRETLSPLPTSLPDEPATISPAYSRISEVREAKELLGSSDSTLPHVIRIEGDLADLNRGKAVAKEKKRLREELNESGETKKKKTKKKKDGLGADQTTSSLDANQRRLVAGASNRDLLLPQEDGVSMERPPGLELSSQQLSQLVSDLTSIALDPFYAIERNAPSIVRHVFLRFRSLVYQKSLILPSAGDIAASVPQSTSEIGASREGREHKEARVQREPSSSLSKPLKVASRPGDLTKSVRKRDPSDRQEELSAKKAKKMNQLKQLASKKKAALVPKNAESQQQPKDPKDSTLTNEQQPPPPKVPSPTFLIMKFPPRSTLPSVSNLKARFARFGPLEVFSTGVFWKTHTCRVLFKHKSDAQTAHSFVQNNDLFGQIKVNYYLRDQEVSPPDQPPNPPTKLSDSCHPETDLHENANFQRPSLLQARQNNPTQLKSILKKPAPDDPVFNDGISRESQRVKFMLTGDEDRCDPPPPPSKVVSSNNGGEQAPSLSQTPVLPPMKSIGLFPPLESTMSQHTPSLSQPPLLPPMKPSGFFPPESSPSQHPSLAPDAPPFRIPPPPTAIHPRDNNFQSGRRLLPPLAPPMEPREKASVDISGSMLNLLLKCNDIVSRLTSSLGYAPYHSL